MATGPCLCGDPYCPSCGNPEQAARADVIADLTDQFIEKLCDADYSIEEVQAVFEIGFAAVELSRAEADRRMTDLKAAFFEEQERAKWESEQF